MKPFPFGLCLFGMILATSLLAGCFGSGGVSTAPVPGEALYRYLPGDGLLYVGYYGVTKDGMSSLREYVGTWYATSILKPIKSFEVASGTYDGNETVLVGFIDSTQTSKDIIESAQSYLETSYYEYGSNGKSPIDYDERTVNGKTIYVVYSTSSYSESTPVCLWDEGGKVGFIYTFVPYSYDSYGNVLKARSCLDVFKNAKQNDKAIELIKKSSQYANNLPSGDTALGAVRAGGDSWAFAATGYSDADAFYGYALGNVSGFSLVDLSAYGLSGGQYVCKSDYYSGSNVTVVERNGGKACKKSINPFMGIGGGYTTLTRASDNGMALFSVVAPSGGKSSSDRAYANLEDKVFSIDLGGKDVEWTDKTQFTVTAYEIESGTYYYDNSYGGTYANGKSPDRTPLSGVKAQLYVRTENSYTNPSYYGSGGDSGSQYGELVDTKYTGSDGKANFSIPNTGSATIVLSKDGYVQSGGYSKTAAVYVDSYKTSNDAYFWKTGSGKLVVKVYEIDPESTGYGAYGTDTIGVMTNATVKLYDNSNYGYNSDPVAVNYTDANGEATFYGAPSQGRADVSKNGYTSGSGAKVDSVYYYSYDQKAKSYLAKITPKNLTVRTYEVEGTDSYDRDPIGMLNRTLVRVYESSYSTGYDEPVAENYTDSRGEAVFYDVPASGRVEASKKGYQDTYGNRKATATYSAIDKRIGVYLMKASSRDLVVRVYTNDGSYYSPSPGDPLGLVRVRVYDNSYGSYGVTEALVENSTGSDGTATLYDVPSSGKVVVTKKGYGSYYSETAVTQYFYSTDKKLFIYMYEAGNNTYGREYGATSGGYGVQVEAKATDDGNWLAVLQDNCASATANNGVVTLSADSGCEHTGAGVWTLMNYSTSGKYNITFSYETLNYTGIYGGMNGVYLASDNAVYDDREMDYYSAIVGDTIFVSLGTSCPMSPIVETDSSEGVGIFYKPGVYPASWHCSWEKIGKNASASFSNGVWYDFSVLVDWDQRTIDVYRDGAKVTGGSISDAELSSDYFKVELHMSHYPFGGLGKTNIYKNFKIEKA